MSSKRKDTVTAYFPGGIGKIQITRKRAQQIKRLQKDIREQRQKNMKKQFIRAFGQIQELFQQLNDAGHISPEQAQKFDESQKTIINYHAWVKQQLDGNIKVELPWTDPRFEDAWKLWRKYKKEQFSFTYKPIGEQGALKDLADLSGGDMQTAIAIIQQSIKKGWRGFFELKQQNISTKTLVNQKPGQILQSDKTKEYDGWD